MYYNTGMKRGRYNSRRNDQIKRKMSSSLWKPGNSARSKGRPIHEKTIPTALRALGSEPMPEELLDRDVRKMYPNTKFTIWQAALAMQHLKATRGYQDAVEFIANRTEGKEALPITVEDITVDIEGEEK
jgi:hypothetical protein